MITIKMVILLVILAYYLEKRDRTKFCYRPSDKYVLLNECSNACVHILYEVRNKIYIEFKYEGMTYKKLLYLPNYMKDEYPRAIGQVNEVTVIVYKDIAICVRTDSKVQSSVRVSFVDDDAICDIDKIQPIHIDTLATKTTFGRASQVRLTPLT